MITQNSTYKGKPNNIFTMIQFGTGDVLMTGQVLKDGTGGRFLLSDIEEGEIGRDLSNVLIKETETKVVIEFSNIESLDAVINTLTQLKQIIIMTYKFKPEFEKKLKGVKRKFIKNLNQYYKITLNGDLYEILNDKPNFDSFIKSAFSWSNTPEGFDFWREVSDR